MSIKALPEAKTLFSDEDNIDEYIDAAEVKVHKKRQKFIEEWDHTDVAHGYAIVPALGFFVLSWLIPIFLGSAPDAFVTIGAIGGTTLAVITWVISSAILSPTGGGLLGVMVKRRAKKLFPVEYSFSQMFKLSVDGDKNTGKITVSIINLMTDETVYSQMFTMSEEVEALNILTEARNIVSEANSCAKQKYVEHKIAAQGFVDRAMSYSV